MFKNVHYDRWNNIMHLWETTPDGKRKHHEINWTPYLYILSKENTGIKSIYNENVKKINFKSYNQYKTFCDAHPQDKFIYENNVKPEIQFLCERYFEIDDEHLYQPKIRWMAFDIEVDSVKLDESKSVRIKFNGEEDYYTYHEFIKIQHRIDFNEATYYDEKKKKWLALTEDAFNISGGFPDPIEADWPVTLITCYDSFYNKTYSFGLEEYTGENLKETWYEYLKFDSEEKLLYAFLMFMHKTEPDVITGWNSDGFDIPYIINRVLKLFKDKNGSEETAKKIIGMMSPLGKISYWTKLVQGRQAFLVDIPGVSILDYRTVYKKYSKQLLGINLESYKLDYVAKFEVEKGKIDYSEYKDLSTLKRKNYNLYVDYNVIDVKRVKQIQEKRQFIELIETLSLLTKCPMKFHESVTSLIEAVFLTYYRRNNLCAEHHFGGVKEPYEAAYCKEPQKGKHRDIVDVDITSSYPHQMMTLNMGSNTVIGVICNFLNKDVLEAATEENIIKCVRKREFPAFDYQRADGTLEKIAGKKLEEFNNKVKVGKIAIAPNGSMFSTEVIGVIAAVVKYVFNKRVEYKNKMKATGKERDKVKEKLDKKWTKELESEFERLDILYERYKSLQVALKLVINATYGAIAVPYFRMYRLSTAEAICAAGRHSIKNGEMFANEILSTPSLSKELATILEEIKNKKVTKKVYF